MFYISICLSLADQALLTLPRGPTETSQSWYANARLGVYICSAVTWSASAPPHMHMFVSRCKEKSAPYSLTIFRHLIESILDLRHARRIEWWSDGGRHFRSAAAIATMCLRGLEQIDKRSEHKDFNPCMAINFGCPNRFKNI